MEEGRVQNNFLPHIVIYYALNRCTSQSEPCYALHRYPNNIQVRLVLDARVYVRNADCVCLSVQ